MVLLSSSAPSSSSCRFGLRLLLGMLVTGLRASFGSRGELSGFGLIDPGLRVLANTLLLLWAVGDPVPLATDMLVFNVSCLAGGSDRRMETRESWSTMRFTAPSSGLVLLRGRLPGEVDEGTAVEFERIETEEACLCLGPDPTAPTGLRVSRSASIGNGRAGSRPEPLRLSLERLAGGGPSDWPGGRRLEWTGRDL